MENFSCPQIKWRTIPPYEFQYRFIVRDVDGEMSVLDFLCGRFSYKSREYWNDLIEKKLVQLNRAETTAQNFLKNGDELHTIRPDVEEPAVNASYKIIHDADGLFVVDKPAPIPVHPSGRYFKNSLLHVLREDFPEKKFHTIHRIDMWTTGVWICATDPGIARILHDDVEKKRVEKIYAVLVVGDIPNKPFVIDAPIGRVGGGVRSTVAPPDQSKNAETKFIPLLKKNFQNLPVALLAAKLGTGRTNQIRVHLQSRGFWVLNDPIYAVPGVAPASETPPWMGLHCREMIFSDPRLAAQKFTAPWPRGFLEVFSEEELNRVFADFL